MKKIKIFGLVTGIALLLLSFTKNTLEAPKISLKAVLVVGHLEDGTKAAIAEMNKVAQLLKSKGITVECFYDNKAEWNKIITAANGANFFIYSGHGTTLGGNNKVGGLCLGSSSLVSSEEITKDLKLHKNAFVLFQSVCYGAGSSAGDDDDIGANAAFERAADYAAPFFKCGAAAYYCNNFTDGCLEFLNEFFAGKTIKDSYMTTAEDWSKVEDTQACKIGNNMEISIASVEMEGDAVKTSYVNGKKKVEKVKNIKTYNIAFIGAPDYTFSKLTSE